MKDLDSFTVERLEEIIAEEGYSAMITPKNDEVRALARIALAAKRAEPCGYAHKNAIKFDLHDTCRLHEQAGDENFIALYTTPQLNSPEIPEDWPTEDMVIAGFESGAWDALSSAVLKRQGWPYSCRESAECVTGIFKAMLDAAPEKENG